MRPAVSCDQIIWRKSAKVWSSSLNETKTGSEDSQPMARDKEENLMSGISCLLYLYLTQGRWAFWTLPDQWPETKRETWCPVLVFCCICIGPMVGELSGPCRTNGQRQKRKQRGKPDVQYWFFVVFVPDLGSESCLDPARATPETKKKTWCPVLVFYCICFGPRVGELSGPCQTNGQRQRGKPDVQYKYFFVFVSDPESVSCLDHAGPMARNKAENLMSSIGFLLYLYRTQGRSAVWTLPDQWPETKQKIWCPVLVFLLYLYWTQGQWAVWTLPDQWPETKRKTWCPVLVFCSICIGPRIRELSGPCQTKGQRQRGKSDVQYYFLLYLYWTQGRWAVYCRPCQTNGQRQRGKPDVQY
jgi:hypothetical protein